jgi:hypothetical protein
MLECCVCFKLILSVCVFWLPHSGVIITHTLALAPRAIVVGRSRRHHLQIHLECRCSAGWRLMRRFMLYIYRFSRAIVCRRARDPVVSRCVWKARVNVPRAGTGPFNSLHTITNPYNYADTLVDLGQTGWKNRQKKSSWYFFSIKYWIFNS